ncbi:MAG: RES family NAD+ phosphorylase [Chthonomonadaceae bacterium]|nr:RES family NAD+ phosphorylase [Chthonomonadaceae bacterium]
MLEGKLLRSALQTIPVTTFRGVLYRAVTLEALYGFHHSPPYPSLRPLYNLGAPTTGARYTPRNGMPSLYLAEDTDTALAEVNQIFAALRRLQLPTSVSIPPCVLFSVNVSLRQILDLSDPQIRATLQTDVSELVAPWREAQSSPTLPATQRLGREAFDSGRIQALRYPSAQEPDCYCYVIFTDCLGETDFVEVYDPDGNLKECLPPASTSPQSP